MAGDTFPAGVFAGGAYFRCDLVGWAQGVSTGPCLLRGRPPGRPPAYLATVRSDGRPRFHPVTPIIADNALFVFMEPTSPKGRDLRERGWYALFPSGSVGRSRPPPAVPAECFRWQEL
jgi:hypothetical protein